MPLNQPFGFQFGVSIGNCRSVHAQLQRQFAAGGNAVARAQIAGVHQRAKLVAQLDVERNMAFRLNWSGNIGSLLWANIVLRICD